MAVKAQRFFITVLLLLDTVLLSASKNCSSAGSSSVSSFKFPSFAFLKYSYRVCSGAVLFLLLVSHFSNFVVLEYFHFYAS